MAAPTVVEIVGGGSGSWATSAAPQVGDFLVAFQATGFSATGPGASPTGTAGTWTVIESLTASADGKIKAWYRPVTVAGVQTTTVSGGHSTYGNWLIVVVVRGASPTAFLE